MEEGKDYYVRFSVYHRISHFVMMTTFIGCALTGPPSSTATTSGPRP